AAWTKDRVPKSLSGSWTQLFARSQPDGASTIHSAEVTSGEDIRFVALKLVPRVRSRSRSVTRVPFTSTVAAIVSPGRTLKWIVWDAAGTSSYQAEYEDRPEPVQSNSEPTCS